MSVAEEPPSDDDGSYEFDAQQLHEQAFLKHTRWRLDRWRYAMRWVQTLLGRVLVTPDRGIGQRLMGDTSHLDGLSNPIAMFQGLETAIDNFFSGDLFRGYVLNGSSEQAREARRALSEFGNAPLRLDIYALEDHKEPVAGRVRGSQLVDALLKGGDAGIAVMQSYLARHNVGVVNAMKMNAMASRLHELYKKHGFSPAAGEVNLMSADLRDSVHMGPQDWRKLWIGGDEYAGLLDAASEGAVESTITALNRLDSRENSLSIKILQANVRLSRALGQLSGKLGGVLIGGARHPSEEALVGNWKRVIEWSCESDLNAELARVLAVSMRKQAAIVEAALPFLDQLEGSLPALADPNFPISNLVIVPEVNRLIIELDPPNIHTLQAREQANPMDEIEKVERVSSDDIGRNFVVDPALTRAELIQRVLVDFAHTDLESWTHLLGAIDADSADGNKKAARLLLTKSGSMLADAVQSESSKILFLTSDFYVNEFAGLFPEKGRQQLVEEWRTSVFRAGLDWKTAYHDEFIERACLGIVQAMQADRLDRARRLLVDFILRSQGMGVELSESEVSDTPYVDPIALRAFAHSELGIHLLPEMVLVCKGRPIPQVFAEAFVAERKVPLANQQDVANELVRNLIPIAESAVDSARDANILIRTLDVLKQSEERSTRNAAHATMTVDGYEDAERETRELPFGMTSVFSPRTARGRSAILEEAVGAHVFSTRAEAAFQAARAGIREVFQNQRVPLAVIEDAMVAQNPAGVCWTSSDRIAEALEVDPQAWNERMLDKCREADRAQGQRLREVQDGGDRGDREVGEHGSLGRPGAYVSRFDLPGAGGLNPRGRPGPSR